VPDAYRDALAAAHERIASLEREVADLERERAQAPERRARQLELSVARKRLQLELERARGDRRRILIGVAIFGFVGTAIFTAVIASLGPSGHPLNAFLVGAVASLALLAIVFGLSGTRARKAQDDLARLDAEAIELMGPVRVPDERIRVEDRAIEADSRVSDEESVESADARSTTDARAR